MPGWVAYFGFCETPSVLEDLDSWIRRRVRCAFWQQWKTSRKRYAELLKRGVNPGTAKNMVGSKHWPWHLSLSKAMSIALPNAELAEERSSPLSRSRVFFSRRRAMIHMKIGASARQSRSSQDTGDGEAVRVYDLGPRTDG